MKLSAFLTATAFAALAIAARADGPATDKESAQDNKEKKVEALLIAAQKICPVSGAPLDSMGGAIKAKSGERTIYLCCKGCFGQPIKAEAWKQIQKNLAEAQGVCAVMTDKPLPENPASVVVEGRTVFVCCKGCIKKVKADPAKALAVVNAQLKKHVEPAKPAVK